MTTGNLLYLVMCVAMFVSFTATMAYESWLQGKLIVARQPAAAAPAATGHVLNA